MVPLLIGAALGAALAAGKHFAFDKPAADRDRKLKAELTRLSPWSNMGTGKGTQVHELGPQPNLGSSLFGGLGMGASMGQGFTNLGANSPWMQMQQRQLPQSEIV